MNTSSFVLKDSSLSLKINGRDIRPGYDFKIISFSVRESIFQIPTFSMQYSTPVNTENMDLSEISISSEITTSDGGKFSVNYSATVLIMYPNRVEGVLIPSDSYYKRRSQSFDNQSLDDIIKGLNLTSGKSNYELNSGISGDNTFFQLNETNWQCGSRLLNLTGKEYLWAVTEDRIKLFSAEVSNPKELTLGTFEGFSLNSSKLVKSLPDSIDDNSNLFYGTKNVCIPSVSGYPKESLVSLMAKRKYDNWRNISISKTVYQKIPNLSIGDSVKFNWESTQITDFILVGLEYTIGQGNNAFTYSFANYSKWNPAGV